MSGYGMGTTIVNYYRKKDDKDEHVPNVSDDQAPTAATSWCFLANLA
jgi:hypothetical protein